VGKNLAFGDVSQVRARLALPRSPNRSPEVEGGTSIGFASAFACLPLQKIEWEFLLPPVEKFKKLPR